MTRGRKLNRSDIWERELVKDRGTAGIIRKHERELFQVVVADLGQDDLGVKVDYVIHGYLQVLEVWTLLTKEVEGSQDIQLAQLERKPS